MNDIINFISTIGFPIFICLYMIKVNQDSDNNTVAIVKLLDKLEGDGKNENK